MKKVAIITIYDMNNYGNRLQNYAVQEILKKRGFHVETLENINIVDNVNKLESGLSPNEERKQCFLDFNENINVAEEVIFHNDFPKDLNDRYDYFVIGSDQIWNYDFLDRFSSFVFLPFASKEKRVALSASFGVHHVPEEHRDKYEGLQEMNYISVREDAGKKLVKELTGREDAVVLIDPTMALERQAWDKVMKKPKNFTSKKYILKYFLGPISSKKEKEIQRVAKENGCDIIDIMDKESCYNSGPAEFVYLCKNAFLIVTDSFHSCVFSVIFNRPFIAFERENFSVNMNSRLETLFAKFELGERIFKDKIYKEMLELDYSKVNKILEEERKKFDKFIDNALLEETYAIK